MPDTVKQEIKLFYCYAREDRELRDQFERSLSGLKRYYRLGNWYDREILAGQEWEKAIAEQLNSADIIFLLVSSDFMASDYCYGIEMQRALERHAEGSCLVIPILLRPTHWEGEPFGKLQLLPTAARPITRWLDRDEAFQDVVREVSRAIKGLLLALKTNKQEQGYVRDDLEKREEALDAYKDAIRLDTKDAAAHNSKRNALLVTGYGLLELGSYEEALTAYDQAIRFDPNYALTHCNKGAALRALKRNEEALTAFDQAIRLNPKYADAYNSKGHVLCAFKRYGGALAAYEKAISLNSKDAIAIAYNGKGDALYGLKQYKEALTAYDQAIRLNPDFGRAYYNKGYSLQELGRSKEAQRAFEKARQLGYY